MSADTPPTTLTADEAESTLTDMVMRFRNRNGNREMGAVEWGREFRSWFDEYEYARTAEETKRFLAETEEMS